MKVVALAGGLRAASAVSRFVLVVYLAKIADDTLLGQVALLATVNAVFTQVAGLELNQVIGRRLHGLSRPDRALLLQRQACACIAGYLLLLPISINAFPDLLRPHWISVCIILVLEHFITEVYRLNIVLLKPVFASSLLFVKNFGWVLLFMGLTVQGVFPPTLDLIVYCWAAVLVLTATPLLLSAYPRDTLTVFIVFSNWWRPTLTMLREALPFIGSAAAIAGIGAVDKLLIGNRFPTEVLGLYYFFFTCASVLTLVVSFGVGSIAGARCVRTHSVGSQEEYRRQWQQLNKLYQIAALIMSVALVVPARPLLELLGKTDYAAHLEMLYVLVGSAALVVCCEPYKLKEYLARSDTTLLLGNIFHFLSLAVSLIAFTAANDIHLAAVGVLLASFLTFLFFSGEVATRVTAKYRAK